MPTPAQYASHTEAIAVLAPNSATTRTIAASLRWITTFTILRAEDLTQAKASITSKLVARTSISTCIPTVFVVDDDNLVRAVILGMLTSVGLRSETFGTAQEFLRTKRPDGPICLVLDVRLPGGTGLDFQRELADAGIRIPIIFITGHGDISMTVKAMKSGAVKFHENSHTKV